MIKLNEKLRSEFLKEIIKYSNINLLWLVNDCLIHLEYYDDCKYRIIIQYEEKSINILDVCINDSLDTINNIKLIDSNLDKSIPVHYINYNINFFDDLFKTKKIKYSKCFFNLFEYEIFEKVEAMEFLNIIEKYYNLQLEINKRDIKKQNSIDNKRYKILLEKLNINDSDIKLILKINKLLNE